MAIYTIDKGNSCETTLRWEGEKHFKSDLILKKNDQILVSNVSKKQYPDTHLDIKNLENIASYIPFEINYDLNLGVDRLMAALGSWYKYKDSPKTLIIDAGTFTTVDLITRTSFEGGLILPGNQLLKETYHKGSNLFGYNLEPANEMSFPLKNTSDCVAKSIPIVLSLAYEKIIKNHEAKTIIITGGNRDFHFDLIKSLQLHGVQVFIEEFIIHRGLKEFFNLYQNRSRHN